MVAALVAAGRCMPEASVLAPAPARVLVRLPNWLGDVIMARPLLHAVRAAWPAARVLAVGPEGPCAPVVDEGLVHEFAAWTRDDVSRTAVAARVAAWRPG